MIYKVYLILVRESIFIIIYMYIIINKIFEKII